MIDEEIAALMTEYDDLAGELVPDTEARRTLYIVWDAGAEVFKHPHSAAVLYSPADVRKKIENYKKILSGREENGVSL